MHLLSAHLLPSASTVPAFVQHAQHHQQRLHNKQPEENIGPVQKPCAATSMLSAHQQFITAGEHLMRAVSNSQTATVQAALL
jgi:hypothetical protein